MTKTPQIERKYRALTTTPARQSVIVQVCKVDEETTTGWFVYGYRITRGICQTSCPRLYFIPKA